MYLPYVLLSMSTKSVVVGNICVNLRRMYMPDDEEQIIRNVSTEWIVPDTVSTHRATHIVIQKPGPTEFVVSFLEQRYLRDLA
jgi:hypothetical protein